MVGTAIETASKSVDNVGCKTPAYKTRRATFALNKKKLTRNLKKDATINMYETTVNNYEQNVNLKCSSGFFLEVASPGFLDLAKQSSDLSKPLKIDDIVLFCTNNRTSLDELDLHLNVMYSYDLYAHDKMDCPLATVTIHCHTTTKLVQL